jgi:hypothetical protein
MRALLAGAGITCALVLSQDTSYCSSLDGPYCHPGLLPGGTALPEFGWRLQFDARQKHRDVPRIADDTQIQLLRSLASQLLGATQRDRTSRALPIASERGNTGETGGTLPSQDAEADGDTDEAEANDAATLQSLAHLLSAFVDKAAVGESDDGEAEPLVLTVVVEDHAHDDTAEADGAANDATAAWEGGREGDADGAAGRAQARDSAAAVVDGSEQSTTHAQEASEGEGHSRLNRASRGSGMRRMLSLLEDAALLLEEAVEEPSETDGAAGQQVGASGKQRPRYRLVVQHHEAIDEDSSSDDDGDDAMP